MVRRPLVAGNSVSLLPGGAAAYPAMLEAIDQAERLITLCTYIFDQGLVGDAFVGALARAHRRNVKVRVLIDAIGVRYRWPPIHRKLGELGVRTALFLPRLSPIWLPFVNLRNHRKILVVDGRIGFTGGMNIRDTFAPREDRAPPSMDLQVRVEGPVVGHLQSAFAEDWLFTTGEDLFGPPFFPAAAAAGPVLCRGIPTAPTRISRPSAGCCSGPSPPPASESGSSLPISSPTPLSSPPSMSRPCAAWRSMWSCPRRAICPSSKGPERPALAGAGPRMPDLALAFALRSHQGHDGGRRLVATSVPPTGTREASGSTSSWTWRPSTPRSQPPSTPWWTPGY